MMRRWHKPLLLGVVTGLIGVFFFLTPFGLKLEEKFGLRWLFHLRGSIATPDDIVLIAIDQPSATQFNLPLLPRLWPRDMHAQLIERLTAAGARIIVFDLIFDSPSVAPEHDKKLAQAMRDAGNIVLIERLTYRNTEFEDNKNQERTIIRQEGSVQLLPEIADAARASAPFPLPKAERVNDYWVFKTSAGDFPTVPAVVLQLYALPLHNFFSRLLTAADPAAAAQLPAVAADRINIEDWMLSLRQLFISNPQLSGKMRSLLQQHNALDAAQIRLLTALLDVYSGDEKRYLNFYGPPRTIQTIPYFQAFQSLVAEEATDRFKGKVVFVGFSGATQPEQDIVRDDYHTVFSNPDGLYISGVEIAATAFANLLENKPLAPLTYLDGTIIVFCFGLGLGVLFQSISTRNAIVSGIITMALYTFVAHFLFKQNAIWIPLIIPLIQLMLAFVAAEVLKHYQAEEKSRRLETQLAAVKKMLGSSFPNPVIEKTLGDGSDETGIYGVCLTTDVEGYTTLSEPMDPGALSRLMMQYRDVLKNPIQQYHGHIMDMTGDSMLAIWIIDSAKISVCALACHAALNLAAAVECFNQSQPDNRSRLPTRIGLHFGEMALRRGSGNYSVTGDVVNTANRIQNANKILKTHILLSGRVIEDLDDFLIRALGSFLLPGRTKPVQLFELIAQQHSADQQQKKLCEGFSRALAAYHSQQWIEAEHDFSEILTLFPNDGPSQFYQSLCRRYVNEPVTEQWPIHRMDSK